MMICFRTGSLLSMWQDEKVCHNLRALVGFDLINSMTMCVCHIILFKFGGTEHWFLLKFKNRKLLNRYRLHSEGIHGLHQKWALIHRHRVHESSHQRHLEIKEHCSHSENDTNCRLFYMDMNVRWPLTRMTIYYSNDVIFLTIVLIKYQSKTLYFLKMPFKVMVFKNNLNNTLFNKIIEYQY